MVRAHEYFAFVILYICMYLIYCMYLEIPTFGLYCNGIRELLDIMAARMFRQICFHIFRSTDMCTSTFYWWFGLGRFQDTLSLKQVPSTQGNQWPDNQVLIIFLWNVKRRFFIGLACIYFIPYLFGSFSEENFTITNTKDTSKKKEQWNRAEVCFQNASCVKSSIKRIFLSLELHGW